MEELLYWGAILSFYLWSAYRNNKKKAKRLIPQQSPPQKGVGSPQIPNNQKINILDFLNEAFEESVPDKVVNSSKVLTGAEDHTTKSTFIEHFDAKHDLSKVDDRHLEHIEIQDRHLGQIKSRLNIKTQNLTNKKSMLSIVQKKYRNNPTKLAITMKAIFESPKSMQ